MWRERDRRERASERQSESVRESERERVRKRERKRKREKKREEINKSHLVVSGEGFLGCAYICLVCRENLNE